MASQVPEDIRTAAAPVDDPSVLVERDLAAWKVFLREQDRLCVEHRFPAALVTVGLGRPADQDKALATIIALLRRTDRIGVLCDTELSVLLVPLESIHEAQQLVHRLDRALREAGVVAYLGWAMRLEGHGLFHAAARADAAMLSARGHGRPAVDLADR
jgi:hypothetical protein